MYHFTMANLLYVLKDTDQNGDNQNGDNQNGDNQNDQNSDRPKQQQTKPAIRKNNEKPEQWQTKKATIPTRWQPKWQHTDPKQWETKFMKTNGDRPKKQDIKMQTNQNGDTLQVAEANSWMPWMAEGKRFDLLDVDTKQTLPQTTFTVFKDLTTAKENSYDCINMVLHRSSFLKYVQWIVVARPNAASSGI